MIRQEPHRHQKGFARSAVLLLFVLAGSGCGHGGGGGPAPSGGSLGPPPWAPPDRVEASGAPGRIVVSWSSAPGATAYVVVRSDAYLGTYQPIATTPATTYADAGVTIGVPEYYEVLAANAGGLSGHSSKVVGVALPFPPGGITAVGGVRQVALAWSVSIGAEAYRIGRASVPGGPYGWAASTAETGFIDTGLADGGLYFYVLQSLSAAGASPDSPEISAVTVPAAPAGLTAAGSPAGISLAWNASAGATAYVVLRGVSSGGPYTAIAAPQGTSFDDTGIVSGGTYYYVVEAVDGAGLSSPSGEAVGFTVPPAPSLSGAAGNASTLLTWTVPPAASGYVLSRSGASGGPYTAVASVGATSYEDSGLTNGTTYFYVVQATNGSGTSVRSNEVALSPSGSLPPFPPAGLSAAGGDQSVALSWTAAPSATGYAVFRASPPSGPLVWLAETGSTSFLDAGLAVGTSYGYVVRSGNAQGTSGDSPTIVGTTTPYPAAPASLTALPGNTQVALAWSASPAATGYVVLRATASAGPYVAVGSTGGTSWTDTGLTNGTRYFYEIESADAAGAGQPSSAASTIPFTAPSSVSATGATQEIFLDWTASIGATAYVVSRGPSGSGPFGAVATTSGTSLVDSALATGATYFYVVQAIESGQWSADSTPASAQTYYPPAAPTGVTAAGGDAEVFLQWNAAAALPSPTAYAVESTTTAGGPYVPVGVTQTVSYVDQNLPNGVTRYYVVQAWNVVGAGPPSSEVSALPLPIPKGVTAAGADYRITVQWSAVTGAASYELLESSVSGGPYNVVPTSTTSYLDGGLGDGVTRFYRVEAVFSYGTSASSPEVSAMTTPVPGAPVDLVATGGYGEITLTWGAGAAATAYLVYRSGSPLGTTTATQFVDGGLANGAAWTYVVQSTNSVGWSGDSNPATATTIPPPPLGLTATGGITQVVLAWLSAPGATAYVVSRGTVSGGPYAGIGTTSAVGFTDAGLLPDTTYDYVVEAANAAGMSAASTEASALTAPAAPAPVTAQAGVERVTLTWGAPAGATAYTVLRSLFAVGPYATAATTTTTTDTDTGLADGTTYYYVVYAWNPTGEGPGSVPVGATTVPTAPAGLIATGQAQQVTLNWTASSGATAYAVYRSTVTSGPYSAIATSPTTQYVDTSVAGSTTYYYVVQAWNAAGGSGYSNQAAASTAPAAPTGLSATGGSGQVALSWTASTGATSYAVLRSSLSGGPYSPVGSTTAASFTDTSVSPGTAYDYVVRAQNGTGSSTNSNEASARTAPSGRTICLVNSSGDSVAAFDALQNGDGQPLRWFGDRTDLSQPRGIAVDAADNEVVVADASSDSITVYPRTATGNTGPLRTLAGPSTGLHAPWGLALDLVNDELLLTSGSSVLVFPRTASGNSSPLRVLAGPSTQLNGPRGIAVDTVHNEITVANNGGDSITVYARTATGNTAPLRSFTSTSWPAPPQSVADDPSDDEIWVGVGYDVTSSTLSVFARTVTGSAAPLRSIAGPTTTLSYPSGLAVDTADGLVEVSEYAHPGTVVVFLRTDSGNPAPQWTLTGPATGLTGCGGLSLDLTNNELWVGNDDNALTVHARTASGNAAPLRTLSGGDTGVTVPLGLSVDSADGEIAVADYTANTVSVYPLNASGDAQPLRVLGGPDTGLNGPSGVVEDTLNGELDVVNYLGASVTVYHRTDSGDAVPLRTLSGSSTTLVGPRGIAVDSTHNELWVADLDGNSLSAFSRTANGNVAPLRTISGLMTGLNAPRSVTVDVTNDEVVAANSGSNLIAFYSRTATGNVAPLRTLAGISTGLNNPWGVLDDVPNGEILVANTGSNAVSAFPRTATGNTTPLRSISGPATLLSSPAALDFCP